MHRHAKFHRWETSRGMEGGRERRSLKSGVVFRAAYNTGFQARKREQLRNTTLAGFQVREELA